MKKSFKFWLLVLSIPCLVFGGSLVVYWVLLPSLVGERAGYEVVSRQELTEFCNKCEKAVANGETWPEDPLLAIQEFSGNRVSTETQWKCRKSGNGRVIVVLAWPVEEDDSVAGIKMRLDLVRDGQVWRPEWGGMARKCMRGRTDWGWWLLTHNPLAGHEWAKPWNDWIRKLANSLNPWISQRCP